VPKKPFDLMKDFAPITGLNFSVLIMVIHQVVRRRTWGFIALAKAKPGVNTPPGTGTRITWRVSFRRWPTSTSSTCRTKAATEARRDPRRTGADDVRRDTDNERQRARRKVHARHHGQQARR
jgi:hypothetical protein